MGDLDPVNFSKTGQKGLIPHRQEYVPEIGSGCLLRKEERHRVRGQLGPHCHLSVMGMAVVAEVRAAPHPQYNSLFYSSAPSGGGEVWTL